jgi:hypothetical protein
MAKKPEAKKEKKASVLIPPGKIKILVEKNPRLKGTRAWKMFSLYRNGMTPEQFLAAGGGRGDLRWDLCRGHIEIKAA